MADEDEGFKTGPVRKRAGSTRQSSSAPLTQSQLAEAIADRAQLSKAEVRRVLDALEEVVLAELGNAQKVKIGSIVQLTVRVKPATKARKGRNPATGEEIMIAAKPATVDVRARALTKTKSALPSMRQAKDLLSDSGTQAVGARSAAAKRSQRGR